MNKDLHNMDDIFKSAHQQFEEEPSADIWNKINADLDKRDAEKYKKRFISWRRIAVVLIILLSGLALYESGVLKIGPGSRNNSISIHKKIVQSDSSLQNNSTSNIPNGQNNNDYANLTDQRETNQKKNYSGKDMNQQILISDEAELKKNTGIKNKTIETNQNVFNINLVKKNKLISNQLSPISNQKNKVSKGTNKELLLADKNNKLKMPACDSDNSHISDNSDNQITAIKRIRVIPLEKISITKGNLLSSLMKEKVLLNITDSIFSKSLVKQQSKKRKDKFKPYWTITGFASNDWAKYKLDNDVEDNNGQPPRDEKQVIAKRERHEPSLSTGIMATRQFSKSLAIKTGLIYSNTAIAINPQQVYATQKTDGTIAYKYNTSSGYGYIKPGFGLPPTIGDSLRSTEAQHNLQSLSIPLQLAYKLEKKKFSIAPSAGITANFITSSKVRTEVEDQLNRESVTINGLNGLKNFYLGFIADVNLQYNLGNHWGLNVLPAFRYAISPITKKNVVKTFPYSFGLGMGIIYKL